MTNKPAKPVVNPSLASEAFLQKRWREVALGHPDTPANERAMFTSFVGVREHYDLAPGGILIGRGTIVRWYSPIAAADLPQLVAKLADASDGELQEFARNYGNLGFTTLTADLKKAFYTWPDGQETMGGDPADWLRAHGANVKRCLEITRCLQLPKDAFAREFDAALVGGVATDDRETWETIDAAFGAVTESINVLIRRRSEIVKAARSVRAALVNPNISGIHRALRSDLGSHGEESAFVFRAPIEAVYWHIANAADGGIVRRCARPNCGGLFISRHGLQTCCAPRWNQKESPCAVWMRQQRHITGKNRSKRLLSRTRTTRHAAKAVSYGKTRKK